LCQSWRPERRGNFSLWRRKYHYINGPHGLIIVAEPAPGEKQNILIGQFIELIKHHDVPVGGSALSNHLTMEQKLDTTSYYPRQHVEYFADTHGLWLPTYISAKRSDSCVELRIKRGHWLSIPEQMSKLCPMVETDDSLREKSVAPELPYKFVKKPGFLAGKGWDQVASVEEAQKIVLENPDHYAGYTCFGDCMVHVRPMGARHIPMDDWSTFVLACPTITYDGELYNDIYCDDSATFNGGFEHGKGGDPVKKYRRPGRGDGLYDSVGLKLMASIDPNDLSQDAVGDCSLMASIAAVCEFPPAVKKLFGNNTKLSAEGKYEVRLWHWGSRNWVTYIIDDRFACDGDDSPFFAILCKDV